MTVDPSPVSLEPGEALAFAAAGQDALSAQTGSGRPENFAWSVRESSGGTVDAAGNYMTPEAEGKFHVVAASSADTRRTATASVDVRRRGIRVWIGPRVATLRTGESMTFAALVLGTRGQSTAVSWSVQEGAGGGTVDNSGRYTAPGAAGTYHVVAASVADPSKKATATVTVTADQNVSVAITPDNASTRTQGKLSFQAAVTGATSGQSSGVTWSVKEGASGGSVDASGSYTAPASAGTAHVVATSVADPSKSATATVDVTAAPAVAVAVSPSTASVLAGATTTFAATVTGGDSGQSTDVTWSIQEGASGGRIDGSGKYTAPATAGTFHVVATSVADPSKSGAAAVTVTAPPNVTVSISPNSASTQAGGTLSFTASVTGLGTGQSSAVSWSIQEGSTGGTINGAGTYTAPSTAGTFHVIATSVADNTEVASATVTVSAAPASPPPSSPPPSSSGLLPADRMTVWNPGVAGGIPARTTICRTVSPPAGDATSTIQAAIDACPAGQVVQLSAGTFTIGTTGSYILLNKAITLRGAGPGQTTLQKTNGAKPGSYIPGPNPSPIVIVGPGRWDIGGGSSTNLTSDAVKGANSVNVASTAGFSAGQFVLLDELSNASWQPDPGGRGQIWASPDFRVVWQRHNPSIGTDDPFPDAAGWFSRQDRPTNEIKQIDHVSGNTVFFTTPIHISYRAAQTAQLTSFGYTFVQNAGIEDLKVTGGDDGNIRFQWSANSWAKNIDDTAWLNEGFSLAYTFHVEVRDSYVHDAVWPVPGGGGYAISLSNATSEALVENSIIMKANKVMVARSAGTASVFGYNYADDGFISGSEGWIEVGLNASHMVGPHHVLFEGNYGFNFDSDKTHGNAILHTVFRNHLSGVRRDFGDSGSGNGPKRAAGAAFYSYWHSFVGNVLGVQGQMNGWVYESGNMNQPAIFLLGWDDWAPYPVDPKVAATTIRHGNFDYVTNSVKWDPSIATQTLPNSLYLSGKPAFFSAGRGYTWPWVDPTGATKLYTLPAKARFDNGTPFVQP